MELPWEYFMAQGGFFFPVWEKCCVLTKVLCSLRCQPRAYLTCNAQHFFGQMVKNVISLKRSLNSLNIGLIYLNMVQISLNMALISLKKGSNPCPTRPRITLQPLLYTTTHQLRTEQSRLGRGSTGVIPKFQNTTGRFPRCCPARCRPH